MTISKIQELKNFISESSALIENKFSKVDGAKIDNIEDERFYAYIEMIKANELDLDDPILEIERMISHITDISYRSNYQIKNILKNEIAKVYYALIGKPKSSNSEYMEIVSSDNFVFSIKDNGWTFE
jgi:hypothetical protein